MKFLINQDDNGIKGVKVRDVLTNERYEVYAKVVVNAAGPFIDSIRKMANEECDNMIMPSAGVHVTLPDYYSPENIGMIIPKSKVNINLFIIVKLV